MPLLLCAVFLVDSCVHRRETRADAHSLPSPPPHPQDSAPALLRCPPPLTLSLATAAGVVPSHPPILSDSTASQLRSHGNEADASRQAEGPSACWLCGDVHGTNSRGAKGAFQCLLLSETGNLYSKALN